MTESIRALLIDDLEQIRDCLASFAEYDFPADLRQRMNALGLSSAALGTRCSVSHTIVDKWKQGKAKPNGKERMKELGMALSMDAADLDSFLFCNGYPRLSAKNPLDSAAKLLLMNSAGWPDIVALYHELIARLRLTEYTPKAHAKPPATSAVNQTLFNAAAEGKISQWFAQHQEVFTGDAKSQLPDIRLIRFILLYLGDATIYEMTVTNELPAALKSLLYGIVGGKAVSVRKLREKLIAFGLRMNMVEDELDTLLKFAKLRLFSEPESKLDAATLLAVRDAHERYPFYESENLERVTARLRASTDAFDQSLLPDYEERLIRSRQMVNYYQKNTRSAEERQFEKYYTSYSDRGVMDYARDILTLLVEDGALTIDEIKPLAELLERTEGRNPLWN